MPPTDHPPIPPGWLVGLFHSAHESDCGGECFGAAADVAAHPEFMAMRAKAEVLDRLVAEEFPGSDQDGLISDLARALTSDCTDD